MPAFFKASRSTMTIRSAERNSCSARSATLCVGHNPSPTKWPTIRLVTFPSCQDLLKPRSRQLLAHRLLYLPSPFRFLTRLKSVNCTEETS
jgi:hypothetical protein